MFDRHILRRKFRKQKKPVSAGRMLRETMNEYGLSQRALARELDISHSQLRQKIKYAENADFIENDDTASAMTRDEALIFHGLPLKVKKAWKRSGADPSKLGQFFSTWQPNGLAEDARMSHRKFIVHIFFTLKKARRKGDWKAVVQLERLIQQCLT